MPRWARLATVGLPDRGHSELIRSSFFRFGACHSGPLLIPKNVRTKLLEKWASEIPLMDKLRRKSTVY